MTGYIRILIKKLQTSINDAVRGGISPAKLTASCCIGMYIAFSPFPGLHMVMVLVSSWLFTLNFPVVFMVATINNPWTMIPFFSLDYMVGYWLVHQLLGIDPSWVISLEKIFGSGKICLWSFLVGGNVLGILSALLLYPVAYRLCRTLHTKLHMSSH